MIEIGVPIIPFFGIDIVSFTIDFVIAYALILAVSLTLNLEAGYAGVPNFGKVLFVAGGAAVAGAVTGRVAVLLPKITTSGDYNHQLALTGLKVRDVAVLLTVVTFCGLVYLYSEGVARSPLGRTLRAIRDDEVASKALGKNDLAVRRNVIIIASAISGMAGALITFYSSSVGPDTWTRVTWTFYPWLVIIIGGAANNLGVGVGAFVFVLLMRGIDQVKFRFSSFIPFDVNWLEYLAFASLLILFLFFRHEGIVPEKPSKTLSESEIAAIMNSRITRRGDSVKG